MQLAHHILGVEEVVLDASLFNKSTLTSGADQFANNLEKKNLCDAMD
jgi:hypothetical protein